MYLIILVIGLGLLIYGIYYLSVRIKLVPMSKTITGTVTSMIPTRTKRGGIAYFPVVEYHDPDTGSLESFQHEVADGRSKYNIGDRVELKFYSGGDKKLVLINTWSGLWSAPIAFIIGGAIFTALGLFILLS